MTLSNENKMPAATQRDLNRKDWVSTTLLKSWLHPPVPTSFCVPSICGSFKDWHDCTCSPHSGQTPFIIKNLTQNIAIVEDLPPMEIYRNGSELFEDTPSDENHRVWCLMKVIQHMVKPVKAISCSSIKLSVLM